MSRSRDSDKVGVVDESLKILGPRGPRRMMEVERREYGYGSGSSPGRQIFGFAGGTGVTSTSYCFVFQYRFILSMIYD